MRGFESLCLMATIATAAACDRGTTSVAPLPSASAKAAESRALVVARPYEMHVPPRHPGHAPLLVFLHGYGDDHVGVAQWLGAEALADRHDFLLALPDGTLDASGKRFWNATDACCNFHFVPVDDVAYLDAVIDDAIARYPVDPARVYVAGYSNGGFMAHRYACDRAERVAGVVSFAGAVWKDASRCKPSVPVSVLEVHGDADPRVRYEGAEATAAKDALLRQAYPGAKESIATWARLDGCGTAETSDDGRDERVRYACAGGSGVELWTRHKGTHILKLTPADMDGAWSFLAAHSRR
jgi:polyhydroxybutyrate depolymerase